MGLVKGSNGMITDMSELPGESMWKNECNLSSLNLYYRYA